jgi:putative aldouronate transport system permease protein
MEKKISKNNSKKSLLISRLKMNKGMYLLILPGFLLTVVFSYLPMFGILIAFKEFDMFSGVNPFEAVFSSPFASQFGLKYFIEFFRTPEFLQAVANTLVLSLLSMAILFPLSILLAILINEVKKGLYKRTIQTVSYLPQFLSMIAVIGIFSTFLASDGAFNNLIQFITGGNVPRIMFLSEQRFFVPSLLFISIWKTVGWNSIIYLAAISGVDVSLYEAAEIDGAGRLTQIKKILLPSIFPTISVVFILNMATIFSSNFELVFGLQNPYINFETIDTIVYKSGILNANYSSSTAVGFAQGLVSVILVFLTNKISKKLSGNSLW